MNAWIKGLNVIFAAMALSALWTSQAFADYEKCPMSTVRSESGVEGKSASGKWNANDSVAANAEHVQELIRAHQLYADGFGPRVPKYSVKQ